MRVLATVTVLTQWLTAFSLFIAIIGAIGAFFWRAGRQLSVLLELPSQVREILKELREVNRSLNNVKDESQEWRERHLREGHPQSPRRRPDR